MKIQFTGCPNGVRIQDKFLINYAKLHYLSKRLYMRILLGKKRRNKILKDAEYYWMDPFNGKKLLVMNEQGYKFWVRVNKNWDFDIVSSERHEPKSIAAFNPTQGDVVIDVGANIGKYSIYAGHLVGKEGKIISIEPSLEPSELLKKSIKENHLQDVVTLIHVAISNKNGKQKLYFSDTKPINSLLYQLSQNYVEVQTLTLDSLVEKLKLKKVDWMKVDVEGVEYEVLEGAKNTLKNNNVNLIIEILKVHEEKVLKFLKDLGYSISILDKYEADSFTGKGFSNYFAKK